MEDAGNRVPEANRVSEAPRFFGLPVASQARTNNAGSISVGGIAPVSSPREDRQLCWKERRNQRIGPILLLSPSPQQPPVGVHHRGPVVGVLCGLPQCFLGYNRFTASVQLLHVLAVGAVVCL